MKKLAMAAALTLLAGAAWADPIEGVWKTQPDDGKYAHVTIKPCGSGFCGTISQSFNADGSVFKTGNTGKRLVHDMVPKGGGKYEGKVWRPSNNKMYIGKMDVKGNTAKLKGCVAGGLLCSGQTWTRVK
ncbi:DUF2147 domain-containing protein [Tropicibacter naphthalenivorans]|uniref:DUF2147 domain-containing protein n=1 Tax=Tropicibacter naphthalenivorans TaxID=441103 RepID=A0A0P1G3V8_9RHOB|nr:DUF2147 domain-containing protein [Tropicibacter naphthalenivorans]CUH76468.1 hypothetical protein TRN7648_00950 [Tropicibacter naphthalenivorans]SMC65970.1 Uncharacterized conserved protein, DUF2147 family [Tropicibacter naphthalenivorans]